MDRLVERGLTVAATAHRGNQTDRAGERGGFVAENVAETGSGENDIELLGAHHDLHRGVVHIEMVERDVRIIARDARDRLPPERGGGEDVGLIHARDAMVAVVARWKA